MKHGHYRTYDDECDECQREAHKIREFFAALDIPILNSYGMGGVLSSSVRLRGDALHDILIDEEKLKILVSKLRNKAFW